MEGKPFSFIKLSHDIELLSLSKEYCYKPANTSYFQSLLWFTNSTSLWATSFTTQIIMSNFYSINYLLSNSPEPRSSFVLTFRKL